MANQLNTATRWYQTPTIYQEEIEASACFKGDNQYLKMTQYVTGSGSTSKKFNWIFATWFKLGGRRTQNRTIIGAGIDYANFTLIRLNSQSQLDFRNYSTQYSNDTHDVRLITKRQFLDISNWYHLIVIYDNVGNPSASNRVQFFINGQRINDFSTEMGLGQNEHSYFCSNGVDLHIGSNGYEADDFWDGYLAETSLIAGVNRYTNDYGESKNGVWVPKRQNTYPSYGGFRLEYKNQTSGGATANDIGAETSGIIDVSGSQATHFTPMGSWGTGNGGLKDTPTNNFPVFNDHTQGNLEGRIQEYGNRRFRTTNTISDWEGTIATLFPTKVKNFNVTTAGYGVAGNTRPVIIGEFYLKNMSGGTNYTGSFYVSIGVGNRFYNTETYVGDNYDDMGLFNSGYRYYNGNRGYNSNWRFKVGDIITVVIDQREYNKLALFYINGTYRMGYYFSGTNNPFTFAVSGRYMHDIIANFGQDSSFGGELTRQGYTDKNGQGDFYYDYSFDSRNMQALCHKNLQQLDFWDVPIDVRNGDRPTDHFKSVWYYGNGSYNQINGVGFKPDFLWIKADQNSRGHAIWNTVRNSATGDNGRNVRINTTDDENVGTATVQSFNTNGFTVHNATVSNTNGAVHHSYSWKAGDAFSGTDTNNDGSVQSSVSTNQKTQFSIINYTGTSDTTFTVGHGLEEAPHTFWVKRLTGGNAEWRIYHRNLGNSSTTHFGQTGSITTNFNGFQNANPTSSVIGLTNDAELGANGQRYLCLAWRSVPGFSEFNRYEGDRLEFVYLGFKPALLIMTNIDTSVRGFYMWSNIQGDNAAVNGNLQHYRLHSTTGNDLENSVDDIEFYSNGFKVKDTIAGNLNNTSQTNIFWAWAEMPSIFSNAF